MNFLKDLKISRFHQEHPYDETQFRHEIDALLNVYFQKKVAGELVAKGEFLYFFIEETLWHIFNRVHLYGNSVDSISRWRSATCLPGRKLAITPDGKFHVCERINDRFPIGDIENGFDTQRALNLVNTYFASLPNCNECWARHFCNICFAAICGTQGFDVKNRCDVLKQAMHSNLEFAVFHP